MSFSASIYLYYLIEIDEDCKTKIVFKNNSKLLKGFRRTRKCKSF